MPKEAVSPLEALNGELEGMKEVVIMMRGGWRRHWWLLLGRDKGRSVDVLIKRLKERKRRKRRRMRMSDGLRFRFNSMNEAFAFWF